MSRDDTCSSGKSSEPRTKDGHRGRRGRPTAARKRSDVSLGARRQELSTARATSAIMDVVKSAAREIAQADGVTFVLRDADRCYYADEDAISPLWKGQRFPMNRCVSGWVMLNARPAFIPDIYTDQRIPAEAYRPTFVRSLAMFPVRATDPIAAIGVYWARKHTIPPEEVKILTALAETTAVAMESVELFNSLERKVQERTSQLAVANRELEAFSHAASHDLRAPIRAIHQYALLLTNEKAEQLDAEAFRWLDRISTAADRMRLLTGDLLRLSQASHSSLNKSTFDISLLATEIASPLREASPAVRFDLEPD